MNTLTIRDQLDRLNKRRHQLVLALQQLQEEGVQLERGTDWLDDAAFRSRADFEDRLSRRYLAEIDQIDKAIARIETRQYGRCLACHAPIENTRLKTAPEAEYCAACQQFREGLSRA